MVAYVGDVNLIHGGAFFDMRGFDDGYASCVRVTDLDSACGYTTAIMVEHLVVLLNKEYWLQALNCCGLSVSDLLTMDSDARRLALTEALLDYGRYDPDDSWDGYQHHYLEVIQTETDGPMQFDGWKADKRVLSENLPGYLNAVHLND